MEIKQNVNGYHPESMPDFIEIPVTERKLKFSLLDDDALLRLPPAKFLIEKIIYKNDVGLLVAPSASGKTFIALNLAYSCATGSKFADRFQVNQQMNVLYCCGEGLSGIRNRIDAAKHLFGHTKDKHGKIAILGTVPNLCEVASVTKFIDDLQSQLFKPDFIIIDTLHTAIPGFDDSSNRDMGTLFSHCKLIRDIFDCVIMLVHHTGKNGAYRGASALFGDADFFIGIDGDKDAHVKSLVFDKIKDGDRPEKVKFELLAKKDSMMVNWLSDDTLTYTESQLWYFENIIKELKLDKSRWFSSSDLADLIPRAKSINSSNSQLAATNRYLDKLEKDGYVSVQNEKSHKNGKDIKLYQYLKDAPKKSVIIPEIELDLGEDSEDDQ